TEIEYSKGSNVIASAVHHWLNNTKLDGIHTIRLTADGCSGQNKNWSMIMMLCMWFHSAPKDIKRIMLVFPIPGHPFIAPDRVFGRIERVINKKECIVDPAEYRTMGEPHYNTDLGARKGFLKRGRRLQDVFLEGINPDEVPPKEKKLLDVNKLLIKHHESNWRELPNLKFYRNLIPDTIRENENLEETEQDKDDDVPMEELQDPTV
ncbi:hypothetical protein ILUMI_16476, partial [Ignelater luminosus]